MRPLVLVLAMGCASRPAAAPVAPSGETLVEGDDPGFAAVERSAAPAPGDTAARVLLNEALRQLRAMKSTKYLHKSRIDEDEGRFEYDCSGFVAYALARTLPDALNVVPIGIKGRPRAEDFTHYFLAISENDPWTRVPNASAIQPGDVIAWLRPAEVKNTNTGHIVIVFDVRASLPPVPAVSAVGGARELLLRVVDSTESPHSDDVREKDTSGLGTGTIGLIVDASDAPIGYRWKGGESVKAYATTVAIARPK